MTVSAASSLIEVVQTLTKAVERPQKIAADVDTVHALCDLAKKRAWGAGELALVDLFSKRIDIGGELYAAYSSSGSKKSERRITDPRALELAAVVICRALMDDVAGHGARAKILKRLNALFKTLDLAPCSWSAPESEIGREIDRVWNSVIDEPSSYGGVHVASPVGHTQTGAGTATFPLTVLFHEGPIARAYLETMRVMGFRAQKLIHLIAANDVATGKPVGRWMPDSWRSPYAHIVQRNRIHHWPRRIAKEDRALHDAIIATVASDFGFAPTTLEAASDLGDLSTYADTIEPVLIEGLNDDSLLGHMSGQPESVILYTGGGIVPAKLLAIPQLRFMHIHPGHLPEIRGADCALWSSLLTGHPSATCFYMEPGIDTGDIILPQWLPRPTFERTATQGVDLKTQYRAVYGFLDPWVRAFVLRDLLATHDSFATLQAIPQDVDAGTTFHFMHERLREAALRRLLTRE